MLFRSDLASAAVAAVALSMLATPPFLGLFARFVIPRFQSPPEDRESDVVDEGAPVLIAGFGRVGSIVGRVLSASGIPSTVLDLDPDVATITKWSAGVATDAITWLNSADGFGAFIIDPLDAPTIEASGTFASMLVTYYRSYWN